MSETCIFTIVSRNYLAYARVLMASVQIHAPDAERIVVLCEPDLMPEDAFAEFELLPVTDIDVPGLAEKRVRYTTVELNTAVKPHAFRRLFAQGHKNVIFFDPDICVYSSLAEMLAEIETGEVLLTPHLLSPVDDPFRPSEADIMSSGAFNLGFIALRRGPVSASFLEWWADRLDTRCVIDRQAGLFLDQKWIDLVPGMYAGVRVVRHPGWNVAYWNIRSRHLEHTADGYTVNGRPLVFFHFSGFRDGEHGLSAHENPYSRRPLPAVLAGLLDEYRGRLAEVDDATLRLVPGYCYLEDGSYLPDVAKQALRQICEARGLSLPTDGNEISALLNRFDDAAPGEAAPLTPLALHIYEQRRDLQQRFPGVPHANRAGYARWFVQAAPREYGLTDAWVGPVRDGLVSAPGAAASGPRSRIAGLCLGVFDQVPFVRRCVRRLTTRAWRQRLRYWLLGVDR